MLHSRFFSLVIYFTPSSVYICQSLSPNSFRPQLCVHTFVLYVCFYFCFAVKSICIIFLDSTRKRYYTILVFLFLAYFTLYDNLCVSAVGTVSFLLMAE